MEDDDQIVNYSDNYYDTEDDVLSVQQRNK